MSTNHVHWTKTKDNNDRYDFIIVMTVAPTGQPTSKKQDERKHNDLKKEE
jgi:hypothetical protein